MHGNRPGKLDGLKRERAGEVGAALPVKRNGTPVKTPAQVHVVCKA